MGLMFVFPVCARTSAHYSALQRQRRRRHIAADSTKGQLEEDSIAEVTDVGNFKLVFFCAVSFGFLTSSLSRISARGGQLLQSVQLWTRLGFL